MSSFIVSDSTLSAAVDGILSLGKDYGSSPGSFLWKQTRTLGATSSKPADIGKALASLNWRAVAGRYPDSSPDDMGPVPVYRANPHLHSRVQQFKALTCLAYQCAEDPVAGTPPYEALRWLKSALAASIVQALPEYDSAQWDLQEAN